MSEKFNLADLLKDVPKLDTNREQIEYIARGLIGADSKNFYSISGLDQLADNIATCGLQQPIRIRPNLEAPGRYIIVSGHRRFSAIGILAKDEPDLYEEIPCIVEQCTSPHLQQLRLIYANANTRTMTSAELSEQAAQVEELLYQLKEEGYEFPGRMRDHVAQACNVSKSKLARLKVIRENLSGDWAPLYKDGTLNESVAYSLAKLPFNQQRILREFYGGNLKYLYSSDVEKKAGFFVSISQIECTHGTDGCENAGAKVQRCAKHDYHGYDGCDKNCCFDCGNLRTCKSSCHRADAQKKEMRDVERKANADAKREQEKKDRPVVEFIQGVYERIGHARKKHGVSVETLYKAQKVMYAKTDEDKLKALESGTAKITANTTLPFGYSFYAHEAQKMCAVADALQCSVDYLLGRDPDMNPHSIWHSEAPPKYGAYFVLIRYLEGGEPAVDELEWTEDGWVDGMLNAEEAGWEVLRWTNIPEV